MDPELCKCQHKFTTHDLDTGKCTQHGCVCPSFEPYKQDLPTRRIRLEKLLFKPNDIAGMNPLVIMSEAYYYRSGTLDGEPIVVRRDGENYRIMDGRHRVMASMIAGRPDVLAVIEDKALWEE